jgi:hypothetical protein
LWPRIVWLIALLIFSPSFHCLLDHATNTTMAL